MFTIYSAAVTGNPGNCSYPHKHVVLDEASLKAAVCHDYVCAEYQNSYRNGDNFIGSDCLPTVITTTQRIRKTGLPRRMFSSSFRASPLPSTSAASICGRKTVKRHDPSSTFSFPSTM